MSKQKPTAIPEPLFIANKKGGFINWLADVLWEHVLSEVEAEHEDQVEKLENAVITDPDPDCFSYNGRHCLLNCLIFCKLT